MAMRLLRASYFKPDAPSLAVLRQFPQKPTELHSHEFSEVVVINSGRGMHVTETDRYPVVAGDVFVIVGDTVHGYEDVDDLSLTNVLFVPERLRLPVRDIHALPGYHALFTLEPRYRRENRFGARLHLATEQLVRLEAWVDELERELDRCEPGYQFVSLALFMELVAFLSRCYGRNRSASSRHLLRIAQAVSFLEAHFAEPVSLEKLTEVAHMSKSSLTRCFQQALGVSPIEYLIRLRVRKAADLLRSSDTKIVGVAFHAGFTDGNYFARQFRRIMGLSPSDYRRLSSAQME